MTVARVGWTPRHWVALGALAAAGLAIRLYLLPDPGYADDLGEFVTLTGRIVENGLGRAFDDRMSFGPVVAYMWWLFGLLDPAFRGALDSSDLSVRLLVKLPPLVADLALAAVVGYSLRARPNWAVVGAGIILLHPVIWFTSAWWGQYESVFVLFGLLAFVLAIRDRPLLAAVALTAALLTKPQALPFVLPFAAWYLARYDLVTVIRSGLTAILAAIALWLPFLPWNGPARYLGWLDYYYNVRFDDLSLRAWNVWWIVQRDVLHVRYEDDGVAVVGPLTYRMIGYATTALLGLVIAYRIWRRPTPTVFALGLAASVLVAFAFLTTMHDRYAYPAVAFLALLPDRRSAAMFSIPVGGLIMWNLLASASASTLLHWQWEVDGVPGLVGSIGMCAAALVAIGLVWAASRTDDVALEATAGADARPSLA